MILNTPHEAQLLLRNTWRAFEFKGGPAVLPPLPFVTVFFSPWATACVRKLLPCRSRITTVRGVFSNFGDPKYLFSVFIYCIPCIPSRAPRRMGSHSNICRLHFPDMLRYVERHSEYAGPWKAMLRLRFSNFLRNVFVCLSVFGFRFSSLRVAVFLKNTNIFLIDNLSNASSVFRSIFTAHKK